MTAARAVVAVTGATLIGVGWLTGWPTIVAVGAAIWTPCACLVAADVASIGVDR